MKKVYKEIIIGLVLIATFLALAIIVQTPMNLYAPPPDTITGYTTIKLCLEPLQWQNWTDPYLKVISIDENGQTTGTYYVVYKGEREVNVNGAYETGQNLFIQMCTFNSEKYANSNIITIPKLEQFLSTNNPLKISLTHIVVNLPDTHIESKFIIAKINGEY